MTVQEIKAYYEGKREGIRTYAWWKEGSQQVGTTGCTLREALEKIDNEERRRLTLHEETGS